MITSKPQDPDGLVERRTDALGNEVYPATAIFSRFLDELVQLYNGDTVNLTRVEGEIENVRSEHAGAIVALTQFAEDIKTSAALSHSIEAEMSGIRRQIGELSEKIDAISALAVETIDFRPMLGEIQSRVENLEHLCQ